jgi:hypothetical protein
VSLNRRLAAVRPAGQRAQDNGRTGAGSIYAQLSIMPLYMIRVVATGGNNSLDRNSAKDARGEPAGRIPQTGMDIAGRRTGRACIHKTSAMGSC